MRKKFNVTGSCNPQRHYMVDLANKLAQVQKLIDDGEYFAINRPHQYGKTTMLSMIARSLRVRKDEYVLSKISFEGTGDVMFANEKNFSQHYLELFIESLEMFYAELAQKALTYQESVVDLKTLSRFITHFVRDTGRDVVLLIDEVDKSSNSQLFLSFLGMLRNKYLKRIDDEDYTFQSVILASVHDVKSLKIKLREDGQARLNSPWNIAADFDVPMWFNPSEIKTMLIDYQDDKGVEVNSEIIAERLYYYTSGYPFLVSKMCKIIDEEMPVRATKFDPQCWTTDHIDWAFRWLTREDYTTTNFDALAKNLENNKALYDLAYQVTFGAEEQVPSFSALDPVVNSGVLYGIFTNQSGSVAIHNRVYEQIITNYMRSRKVTRDGGYPITGVRDTYEADGCLDMRQVLLRFQAFMKEQSSKMDARFIEREGRLVFLSFLRPIINGKGFAWKEPVVGDERRMDIVVTYGETQKEVIELKVWRGEEYHLQGLQQLSKYLDFQGVKAGFLLIFDFRINKKFISKEIDFSDKSIFAVWV